MASGANRFRPDSLAFQKKHVLSMVRGAKQRSGRLAERSEANFIRRLQLQGYWPLPGTGAITMISDYL